MVVQMISLLVVMCVCVQTNAWCIRFPLLQCYKLHCGYNVQESDDP